MPFPKIHEVVAITLNKGLGFNETLLRIGTIAPDSWRDAKKFGGKNKYLSHFWNFRKPGVSHDYDSFYLKYYSKLNNPFYFGYLIHLMTDQYWKSITDSKYKIEKDGKKYIILKDGSLHDTANNFSYIEDCKLEIILANKYNLSALPINREELGEIDCNIDEIDLTGLFGTNGMIDNINKIAGHDLMDESKIYNLDTVISDINTICEYIKNELERLKNLKNEYDKKIKIAISLNDTSLNLNGPIINKLKRKGYIVDGLSNIQLNNEDTPNQELIKFCIDNNINIDHINFGYIDKLKFVKEHDYDILIDSDYVENIYGSNIKVIRIDGKNVTWDNVPELVEQYVNK